MSFEKYRTESGRLPGSYYAVDRLSEGSMDLASLAEIADTLEVISRKVSVASLAIAEGVADAREACDLAKASEALDSIRDEIRRKASATKRWVARARTAKQRELYGDLDIRG